MTEDARRAVRMTGNHPVVENGARGGYALLGLLHVIIGYLALRVAWSSSGESLDQSGALRALASTPGGRLLLVVMVVAFGALALFYLADAAVGHIAPDTTWERVKSAGKAVVYVAVAWTAFTFVRGSGKNSTRSSVDATQKLMEAPGGQVIVGIVGAAVIVGGLYHVRKGVTNRFLDDLEDDPGTWASTAGTYGYVAKGVALVVVGGLFVVAAVRHQPKEARGLDGALHTLAGQPYGAWLLTLVALGFVAFGLYSFARARHMRT